MIGMPDVNVLCQSNPHEAQVRKHQVVVANDQAAVVVQTDVPLHCKDTMPNAAAPQLAAPSLGGTATPLLFSSPRGSMKLRVGTGSWSPSINLEKIGEGPVALRP